MIKAQKGFARDAYRTLAAHKLNELYFAWPAFNLLKSVGRAMFSIHRKCVYKK